MYTSRPIIHVSCMIIVHKGLIDFYALIGTMTRISEAEFRRLVDGIIADRESIVRHNPIGTPEEILLWMLLNSLVVYLSLNELETPCFTGRPDASVYRDAIEFVLRSRKTEEFDTAELLDKLSKP